MTREPWRDVPPVDARTVLPITPELVERLLHLPDGAHIVGASWDDSRWVLLLALDAPGWPAGELTPTITEVPRTLVWRDGDVELGRAVERPYPPCREEATDD